MDISALWDPASAAIVLGGTILATGLRAGFGDLWATTLALNGLARKRFDYSAARAEIAAGVEDIRHNGLLRGQPGHSTDPEISDATGALVRHRSLQAAMSEHERHKQQRKVRRNRALRTLYSAADLAPIFGLAGTLLALSQLPAGGIDAGNLAGAIGMAVLSTLYGLLVSHLALMPLARWIERAGEKEEVDRQHLFDWLGDQLSCACPKDNALAQKHAPREVA